MSQNNSNKSEKTFKKSSKKEKHLKKIKIKVPFIGNNKKKIK